MDRIRLKMETSGLKFHLINGKPLAVVPNYCLPNNKNPENPEDPVFLVSKCICRGTGTTQIPHELTSSAKKVPFFAVEFPQLTHT